MLYYAHKKGYRSVFQFEETEDKKGLVVFFGRTTPEEPEIELKPIATVHGDIQSFMRVVQSKLEMMDDDTWVEPEEWTLW